MGAGVAVGSAVGRIGGGRVGVGLDKGVAVWVAGTAVESGGSAEMARVGTAAGVG